MMALFNQLAAALGKDSVFMYVANIDLRRDFGEALNERLASCDLMLAIVGRGWVEGKGASGRRRFEERLCAARDRCRTQAQHPGASGDRKSVV